MGLTGIASDARACFGEPRGDCEVQRAGARRGCGTLLRRRRRFPADAPREFEVWLELCGKVSVRHRLEPIRRETEPQAAEIGGGLMALRTWVRTNSTGAISGTRATTVAMFALGFIATVAVSRSDVSCRP